MRRIFHDRICLNCIDLNGNGAADADLTGRKSCQRFCLICRCAVCGDFESGRLDLGIFNCRVVLVDHNADRYGYTCRNGLSAVLAGSAAGLHARCEDDVDISRCSGCKCLIIRKVDGIGLAASRRCDLFRFLLI